MNCKYDIELNGIKYEFGSTAELNSFIRNNKNRLEAYINKKNIDMYKGLGNLDLFDLISENNINEDLFDKIQSNFFKNEKFNLKNRPEKHSGEKYTFDHILNVVNTAKTIKIPKNIDRKVLIIAALLHDIGKPYRNEDHGLDGVKVINKLFKDNEKSKLIKLLVRHHMLPINNMNSEYYESIIIDVINNDVNVNEFIELLLALNSSDIIRNRNLDEIDDYSKKTIKETLLEEIPLKRKLLNEAYRKVNPSIINGSFTGQDNRIEFEIKGNSGKEFLITINRSGKIDVFSEKTKYGTYIQGDRIPEESIIKLYNKYIPQKIRSEIINWNNAFKGSWASIETEDGKNYENIRNKLNEYFKNENTFTISPDIIKFSKNFSKFEETCAKLQNEISNSEKLVSKNSDGDIIGKGYTGVSKKIKDYRLNGNRIIPELIKENYIQNYINQNFDKTKVGNANKSDNELKNELRFEAEKNIENWSHISGLGTDIHKCAEYYINTENPNLNELKSLITYNIPDSAIQSLFDTLKSFKNYLSNRYGDQYKLFTEVKLHDPVSKVAGILDLVVIDKNGKAHIIDYKASLKAMDDWNSAKDISIKYQMACYKQLLRNSGIDTESISIMPIKINEMNFADKTFSSLTFEPQIDLLADVSSHKYDSIANDIIPISKVEFESNADVSENIRKNLKDMFGYDVKSRMVNSNLQWFKDNKILTDSKGKYFIDYEGDKAERVSVTDSNMDEKIKSYFEKQQKNQGSLVKNLRSFLNKCQSKLISVDEYAGKKNEKIAMNIANVFGTYATDDWEVIENDESDALGIMLFRNKKTSIIDIISITNNSINEQIKLPIGTTILGNHVKDSVAKRDERILPSKVSSIEFMKVATFLNENVDRLTDKGMTIGTVRAFSFKGYDADGITYEDLKYNFGKLAQASGTKSNLSKLQKSNPYNLLMSRLDYIVNNVLTEQNKMFYSNKLENLQNNILDNDRIRELIDLQNELLKITERSNVYSEYNDLLKLVSGALLFYKDINVRYELDIKKWALNNSGMLTNPMSFSGKHKNIQQIVKLAETAMYNIRGQFVDYKEKNRDIFENLFESVGYSKLREYAVGDNVKAYDNLFRMDNTTGKKDSRLLLKDPDDMRNGLNSTERAFIRHFLDSINKNRFKTIEAQEEAKMTLEWYGIPLIKGSTYTKIRNKSYKSAITEYWKDMFNYNNFFDEDFEISRQKSDEMIEVFDSFENQNREKMLLEHAEGEFETDLELVLDTFNMSKIRKNEFDKVLPYINAIRVVVDNQSRGILNSNAETLDYTKRYIRNVIYNDKMIEDNLETVGKFTSALRDVTSMFTLGFNTLSGVREFLQGQFGNVSKMASQYYGKNAFTTKDYKDALKIMLDDSSKFFTNLTLVEELNNIYGLSGMDINNIVQKLSSSNKGILAFRSRWGFWMNSGPEYFNRMTLFISQMMHEGIFEAHELKNGKLVYDWKKDKRFSAYANKKVNDPKYKDQEALYFAMLNSFNKSGYELKEGDALPNAYTVEQRNNLKSFSDKIYGSYDHESKVMFENTIFGMMMMQFKKWIFAKKDQYLLKGGEYCNGDFVHVEDENGNKLYRDSEGNVSTDPSGTKILDWRGNYMEGIFWSVKGLIKDCIDNRFDLKAVYQNAQQNTPEKIANMKTAMYDMGIFLILAIIGSCVDWKELKDDKSYMASFYKTVLNSGNDLYVGNNIETMINAKNPIPSIGYAINFKNSFGRAMTGDDSYLKIFTSNIGVFRPFDNFVE